MRTRLRELTAADVCILLQRIAIAEPRLPLRVAEARIWRRVMLRHARAALQDARTDFAGGRWLSAIDSLEHAAVQRANASRALLEARAIAHSERRRRRAAA